MRWGCLGVVLHLGCGVEFGIVEGGGGVVCGTCLVGRRQWLVKVHFLVLCIILEFINVKYVCVDVVLDLGQGGNIDGGEVLKDLSSLDFVAG